jgi:hypothetical protein
MSGVSEYQKRAQWCAERAQSLTNRIDRARWLQLAEQWDALSRMPLRKGPMPRNDPAGFWRGEPRNPLPQSSK